jgi:hypothetical protein
MSLISSGFTSDPRLKGTCMQPSYKPWSVLTLLTLLGCSVPVPTLALSNGAPIAPGSQAVTPAGTPVGNSAVQPALLVRSLNAQALLAPQQPMANATVTAFNLGNTQPFATVTADANGNFSLPLAAANGKWIKLVAHAGSQTLVTLVAPALAGSSAYRALDAQGISLTPATTLAYLAISQQIGLWAQVTLTQAQSSTIQQALANLIYGASLALSGDQAAAFNAAVLGALDAQGNGQLPTSASSAITHASPAFSSLFGASASSIANTLTQAAQQSNQSIPGFLNALANSQSFGGVSANSGGSSGASAPAGPTLLSLSELFTNTLYKNTLTSLASGSAATTSTWGGGSATILATPFATNVFNAASVTASTGADGAYNPLVSGAIATPVCNFTTITIPLGVTITAANGVALNAQGSVNIAGTLQSTGSAGSPGPGNGMSGGNAPALTVNASGTMTISGTIQGAGGNGGDGGLTGGTGGNGAAITLDASTALNVTGTVLSNGGAGGSVNGILSTNGGNGGNIVLNAPTIAVSGRVASVGGSSTALSGSVSSGGGLTGATTFLAPAMAQATAYDAGGVVATSVVYTSDTFASTTPGGSSIVLQFDDGDAGLGVTWSNNWRANITTLSKRYVRFRALLTPGTQAPVLTKVTINYHY